MFRNRKVEWNPVLVKYFISLRVQAEGKGYNLSWAENPYLSYPFKAYGFRVEHMDQFIYEGMKTILYRMGWELCLDPV